MTTLNLIKKEGILDMVYPVGAIYMSVNETNPSVLFGGTWERMTDRYLFASGSGYSHSDYYGVGAKSHTLTVEEIPSHNHNQSVDTSYNTGWGSKTDGYAQNNTGNNQATIPMKTGYTGGGSGHTHNVPYFAVCVWKRTA